MKLMVGFVMFGSQLTLWNLLKIVMSELYKRLINKLKKKKREGKKANKLKRLKTGKKKNFIYLFIIIIIIIFYFEKTNFFLDGQTPYALISLG